MAVPPPFATVADLGFALQRPNLDRDAGLLALERASGAIRGWCGWSITREVVTSKVINNYSVSSRLWLPTLWLVSVDSLVEDTFTLVPNVDFAWDASGKVRRGKGFWSTHYNAITVGYTHGYDPTTDTARLEPLRTVCLAVAGRLLSNPLGHAMERSGTEQWQISLSASESTLTDGEKEDLEPYRLEPF
jgi:hypothetical protein